MQLKEMQFISLFNYCSLADKAKLLLLSSLRASAWIYVVPSLSLVSNIQSAVYTLGYTEIQINTILLLVRQN